MFSDHFVCSFWCQMCMYSAYLVNDQTGVCAQCNLEGTNSSEISVCSAGYFCMYSFLYLCIWLILQI